MGGLIGAGASIWGGIQASKAAKEAAGQQASEFNQALGWQQNVYGNTQRNLQPWIGGGQQALGSLLGFYGLPGGNAGGATQAFQQFQNTPYYQFGLNQGQLGLNRQLASSGLTGSGAALKDAIGYNQGYASQQLGGYLQGLSGISGIGQNSAVALGQQGNQAAQLMFQGYQGIGNAQAAGTIGSANAINQGIQGAMPYIGNLFGGPGGIGGSSYGGGSMGGPYGGVYGNPYGAGGGAGAGAGGFGTAIGNYG